MILAWLLGCPPAQSPSWVERIERQTADTAQPRPAARNVLVFLIDDVGPERFSSYAHLGSEHIARTPVIDQIAQGGMVFDRGYATPLCSNTRATLLTSRHAFRHRVGAAIFPDETHELGGSERTWASALKMSDRDWSTAAFGKWHLTSYVMEGHRTHANRHGFDHFDGTIPNPPSFRLWQRTRNGMTEPSTRYHTNVMLESTLAWLQTAEEPWFVYVPFFAAHAPWHTPPQNFTYTDVTEGDDSQELDWMLETVDISIGATLASLSPEVRANTLVVIVGDNGTPDQVAEFPADPARAKGTLSEGGVRVPMFMAGPGIPAGRTDALASVMDIWPTIAELTGETLPNDRDIDGVSLVPTFSGEAVREVLYIDAAEDFAIPPADERGQLVVSATHHLEVIRSEEVTLHRVGDFLEGPDLLTGPLEPEDQQAYDQLYAEYERMEALTQATWFP